MADFGELLVRLVVSLGIVLAFIGGAYAVAKRRQSGPSGRSGLISSVTPRRRARVVPQGGLHVEARTGLARGSAAVAVRFADRIVLIGVSDGAPSTVLADVPAGEWDIEPESPSDSSVTALRTPLDPNGVVAERPNFVEALRTATSRRR